MSERKMVMREVAELDFDGYFVKDVIRDLTEKMMEYGPKAIIGKEQREYSDGEYFCIRVERPETDEEMASRVYAENQNKATHEQFERKEFERLSAKFANKE